MGLLDRLFNNKAAIVEDEVKKPILVQKEIESIALILENLRVLDPKKIKSTLKRKGIDIDTSILNRLMISVDDNDIRYVKKYFESINVGYGPIAINTIKDKLNDISVEKEKEGKNKAEIVEELIEYGKEEVEKYKNVLMSLNSTINKVEENATNDADLLVMINYWINYYKEEQLGYPVDLNKKVETMVRELQTLPYGGYGTDEIDNFRIGAFKIIEDGASKGEDSNFTLNRIINTTFLPRKNRYLSDVSALKKKIELISTSTSLDDNQKKVNIAKTVEEFNKINGHKLKKEVPVAKESPIESNGDNSIFLVEVNIEELMNIDDGGYGPNAISEYRNTCRKIMNSDIPEEEKYIQINKNKDLLVDTYHNNKDTFTRWKIAQLVNVSAEEKGKIEEQLDKQIKYMLSLSPQELNDYYIEDSRKKKEAIDRHNYEVAFKYLAVKEAEESNNPDLLNTRLKELAEGKEVYSEDQIEDAYTDLLISSITEGEDSENNFIDAVTYIDSTLAHQIFSMEQAEIKKI